MINNKHFCLDLTCVMCMSLYIPTQNGSRVSFIQHKLHNKYILKIELENAKWWPV